MIKGITYILKNDSTFQSIVGQNAALSKYKAYPVISPQTEVVPFSVCRMNSKRMIGKGRNEFECSFTVSSYHKNYDDVEDLDYAVVQALVPRTGTYNGVTFGYIEFENTSDSFEMQGELYGKVSSFNCQVTLTALT